MSQQSSELFGSGWGNYAIKGIVELQLPDAAVSLWPHTLGWQVLLVIFLFCLVAKVVQGVQRYWRDRYRRVALEQLASIKQQVEGGDAAALRSIPELLKATALHAYPRKNIAELFGGHWETFLDSSYQGPSFAEHVPGYLYALSYSSLETVTNLPGQQFWSQLELWIKSHQRDKVPEAKP